MNLKRLRKKLPGSKAKSLIVNSIEGYKRITEVVGILITTHVASKMAKVSQQRIYRLINRGMFVRIVVFGVVHVAYGEFETWRRSPRVPGRPRKEATNNGTKTNFGSDEIGELKTRITDEKMSVHEISEANEHRSMMKQENE